MTRFIRAAVIGFSVLVAGASTACAPPPWQYEVDRFASRPEAELRRAFIEQESILLGSRCSARLEFTVTRDDGAGATGMLNLEFTVSPAGSIPDFDFQYFEGPDAPARGQTLMTITVTQGSEHVVRTFGQNGYWSAEVDDGFAFQTASMTRDRESDVRRLLDQLREGARSIEISVTDGRNPAIVLSASFPLSSSEAVFEALLEGI